MFYRLAADVVVIVHFAYVAFVVLGLAVILLGGLLGWSWVRNWKFRWAHLAAIGIVVFEALMGITCPLTTWEQKLRRLAGEVSYRGDFIASWAHELLFYEAQPWVFTVCYVLFGLAVLGAWFLIPPRSRRAVT